MKLFLFFLFLTLQFIYLCCNIQRLEQVYLNCSDEKKSVLKIVPINVWKFMCLVACFFSVDGINWCKQQMIWVYKDDIIIPSPLNRDNSLLNYKKNNIKRILLFMKKTLLLVFKIFLLHLFKWIFNLSRSYHLEKKNDKFKWIFILKSNLTIMILTVLDKLNEGKFDIKGVYKVSIDFGKIWEKKKEKNNRIFLW